ncbi:MAG: alpha/beta hydrolase [Gemmatimonadales bacterium]|nr:MAG: alpha/beta hydrolase [Gemmatimonadales bacterium]
MIPLDRGRRLGAADCGLGSGRGGGAGREEGSVAEEGSVPEEGSVAGTLIAPPGPGPFPGWVVLHGITRPGRNHRSLRQFASALASTGARVLIPEIRHWRELDLAPEPAQRILRSAVRWLAASPGTESGGVMLVGFSFGGPQAILAASDPDFARELKGVLAWGSYADLERTLRFQFTGEHAYAGTDYRQAPDPYGRWVVAANCLPHTPGKEDAADVASALRGLAARAGDLQIPAHDPSLEPLRQAMRAEVADERKELFDLFAPPMGEKGGSFSPYMARERALSLIRSMSAGARAAEPLLDPLARIERITVPVRLLHGKGDVLIPFTETLALADQLRPRTQDLKVGITGLFAHSGGNGEHVGVWSRIRENFQFLRVLRRVFEVS